MHISTMKLGRHREDREKNVLRGHSFFVRFMERHGLWDCIKYFPDTMTLGDLKCLTSYDLVSRYDLKDPKDYERILKVTSASFKEDQSDSELECSSSPKQPTSSNIGSLKDPYPSSVGQLNLGKLLCRTVSEDMRYPMRARDKYTLFHQNFFTGGYKNFSSQYGLNQASSGSSASNESSNLVRFNVLGLGKSAPSLSMCQKDHHHHHHYGMNAPSTKQFSSRLSFRNPSLALTSSSLSLAQQASNTPIVPCSPVDSPRIANTPSQNFQFQFLSGKNLVDNRRWSVASLASSGSGNNTPACSSTSANMFSSQDRLFSQQQPPLRHHHHHHHRHYNHHHYHHHHHHSSTPDRHQHSHRHFSSSDSNPTSINDIKESSPACSLSSFVHQNKNKSPLMRPRSQSLSSPAKSSGSDSGTMLLNNIYRERFPKAVLQMEGKLKQFIEGCQQLDGSPHVETDGAVRFICRQIIEMAKDCLGKSRENLISLGYFYELSESLEKLLQDTREKSQSSVDQITELIKNFLVIISRPARLLECLEFDPQEFYRFLEVAEGHARETIKTDIPKYIINKLALTKETILPELTDVSSIDSGRPETPETEELSESSSNSTFVGRLEKLKILNLKKQPNQDDFETIKLISNGAYGAVYMVRHIESRRIFAMKRLLKSNLVLRNQVDQVFVERDILTFTDNPFVVSFFCSFETKKHLCMVLEYVEGGDCATLLKNVGRPLSFDLARMYFAETVLALEYLHSYGIVHRDLKPDNLLITLMGHIKLTDFGLSKMGLMNLTTNVYERSVDRDCKQFTDKQVFGTPEYIAPEVILRQGYGKPVDWWSMGIILYEFLVGCVPFFGDTPEALFSKIINDSVEWPQEDEFCPPADAQDLILQLLDHNPLERLGSGGTLEVKEHLFFEGVDWNGLLRLKAEFIPNLASDDDTSYFDSRLDRYNPEGEDTDDNEDIMFNSFSSCSPRYSKVYLKFDEFEKQQNEIQDGNNKQAFQTLENKNPDDYAVLSSTCVELVPVVSPSSVSSSSPPVTAGITSTVTTKAQTSVSSSICSFPPPSIQSTTATTTTTSSSSESWTTTSMPSTTKLDNQSVSDSSFLPDVAHQPSISLAQKLLCSITSLEPSNLEAEAAENFQVKLRHPKKGNSNETESKAIVDHAGSKDEVDDDDSSLKYLRRNIKVIESADLKEDRMNSVIPLHVSSFPHIHLRRMHSKGKFDLPKFSFSTEDSSDACAMSDKDKEDQDQLGPLRPLVPSKSAPAMPHVCESDKSQVILMAPKEFKKSPLALETNKSVPKSTSSLVIQSNPSDEQSSKSSITVKKGSRGYGFTLRAIRVYYGDSQYYTLHHLVVSIENGSPAMEAGMKAGNLITHVNNISVQGLLHIELVRLILSGGNKLTIRTTPLSSTTIRLGNRKQMHAGNLNLVSRYVQPLPNTRYRRSFGSTKSLEDKKKRSSLFRRLSNRKVEQLVSSPVYYHQHPYHNVHQKLSFSSDGSCSIPDSPTLKLPSCHGTILTPSPTSSGTMMTASPVPSPQVISPWKVSNELLSSSSQDSSSPGSPAFLSSTDRTSRPSSLYGLRHHPRIHGGKVHKTNSLQLQCSPNLFCIRRRSWHNNPLSPLVKTPSSSPLGTPASRSPSPSLYHLHHPGISNMSQVYNPSNSKLVHPPQYKKVTRVAELSSDENHKIDAKKLEDVQRSCPDNADNIENLDKGFDDDKFKLEKTYLKKSCDKISRKLGSELTTAEIGDEGEKYKMASADFNAKTPQLCEKFSIDSSMQDSSRQVLNKVASNVAKSKSDNKPGKVNIIPIRVIPHSSSPSYTSIYIPKSPIFKVSQSPLKTSTFQFPPVSKPHTFISEIEINREKNDLNSPVIGRITSCRELDASSGAGISTLDFGSSSNKLGTKEIESQQESSGMSDVKPPVDRPSSDTHLPKPEKCSDIKMFTKADASPHTFHNETKGGVLVQERSRPAVKVNIKVEKRRLFKK